MSYRRHINSWGQTNKKLSSFRQKTTRGKKSLSNFYPHKKPAEYAYTEHFMDVGNDTVGKALINTQYPGIDTEEGQSRILQQAIQNLDSLIAGARAAELAFIGDTGIDINNMNGKDVFKTINRLLNSKDTFERALQFLKQQSDSNHNFQKETDATYRAVARNFGSYLDNAIANEIHGISAEQILHMNPNQVKDLINNIISKALELSYIKTMDFMTKDGSIRMKDGKYTKARTSQGETTKKAVEDMLNIIQDLRGTGAFREFGDLFKLNQDTLMKRAEGKISFKKRKGNKYNNAQVDSNYGGSALEVLDATVGAYLGNINITTHSPGGDLHIVGQHTGNWNKMKGDAMLFVGRGNINIPDYMPEVDYSIEGTRAQNYDALSKYLNKLESNISHVIVISDKNYSIKLGFNGIDAQTKMNLKSAGDLLSRMGVDQVDDLINYLANCGASMVQGQVHAQVRTVLQSHIANFLFDHLEIQGSIEKPTANVVNIMNVSGIYIPLSVYLEGIRDSLLQVSQMSPSSFVSVSISLGGPTSQRIWTEANWSRFRDMREESSFIEYKILKNIASFISGLAD